MDNRNLKCWHDFFFSQVLRLGYNDLGNDGCNLLADALLEHGRKARDSFQLQELHVEWNGFTCLRGLTGALQHYAGLKVLNLTGH
jgi:hypothetical protein